MKKNKNAQFIEIDFFLAILILATGIILISQPFIHTKEDIQADRLSYDAITILNTMNIQHTANYAQYKSSAEYLGFELNPEDTIAITITKLLAKHNQTGTQGFLDLARNITNETLTKIIPPRYSFETRIHSGQNELELLDTNTNDKTIASQSRTLLSGIDISRPITGFISTATLSTLSTTKTNYIFIGGFIGQGNMTLTTILPNYEQIFSLDIQGQFHDDFEVRVNGYMCINHVNKAFVDQTFTNCNRRFSVGKNKIEIRFKGTDINKKYVSGGIIKVNYEFNEEAITQTPNTITERKYLTGINGLINVYDSIFIPGKLRNMRMNITHNIDIRQNQTETVNLAEFRITIGNRTVYADNTTGLKTHQANNIIPLNELSQYNNATIPIRLGFPELTTVTTIIQDGAVDLVLSADLSESMGFFTNETYLENVTTPGTPSVTSCTYNVTANFSLTSLFFVQNATHMTPNECLNSLGNTFNFPMSNFSPSFPSIANHIQNGTCTGVIDFIDRN